MHSNHPEKITKQYLVSLRRKALRTGKWFKLDKYKRAALELAIKTLQVVRSKALLQIIEEIISLVDESRARLIRAYRVGLKVVQLRVEQALQLGYRGALKWLKDPQYILQVGLGVLNIPPAYRPQVGVD